MDPLMFSLFWVFGWVILLLVAWQLRSSRRERKVERQHKERMMAMEKGIPLPELPADEEPDRRTRLHRGPQELCAWNGHVHADACEVPVLPGEVVRT